MSMLKRSGIQLALWACVIFSYVNPSAAEPEKAQIDALYLYNFFLFVDWPEGVAGSDTAFYVVIADDDDSLFEELAPLSYKPIRGRRLIVSRITSVDELRFSCHVLFIGCSQHTYARQYLAQTGAKPVLTMSGMKEFTKMGGMVYVKQMACATEQRDGQKRFEINLSAVRRTGLRIRAKLLRLSDVFYPDDGN